MANKTKRQEDAVHRFNIYIPSEEPECKDFENNVHWGDVKLDVSHLQKQLSSFLSVDEEDFLLLAVAIAHVDRRVSRGTSETWRRNLFLRVPVCSPEKWSNAKVLSALKTCLELLTRDAWDFEFYQRRHNSLLGQTGQCGIPMIKADAAMPYSDGLDSMATWAICPTRPLAVTIGYTGQIKQNVVKNNRPILNAWIDVNICVNGGHHPEATYRTRSFMFFSICAILANKFGINEVIIPETGQGAIGAAMIQWGHDYSYYGAHPLFTFHLHRLLSLLFKNIPKFAHPNIWLTKGDVLQKCSDRFGKPEDFVKAVHDTYSCSRRDIARRCGKSVNGYHCGICPNCVLRRLALFSAGLKYIHERESYIWRDLSKSKLEEAQNLHSENNIVRFRPTERDRNVARTSFIIHRDFASLQSSRFADRQLRIQASQLAQGLGLDQEHCLESLRSLVDRHSRQWTAFVDECIGRNSFLIDLMT